MSDVLASRLIAHAEAASDRLSPMVVKEVRQFVRGREFLGSFAVSLIVALGVAFYGSADALSGGVDAGRWTFTTLTSCLALLGLAVVPIGAFTTLRTERLEQTLDLISLTALSPRRIVTGKLLAQAVKLVTFFSVMAPFIATCFLLGGVDFVTVLAVLVAVFLWSMWAAAAALFMSTMFRSRAMSGVALGALGVVMFLVFIGGRSMFFFFPSRAFSVITPSRLWWGMATMAVFCVMTMVNLVLLSENRLAPVADNSIRALRVGFLVQFLLIVGTMLTALMDPTSLKSQAFEQLAVFGGLHLAVVAAFGMTEGLAESPRFAPRRRSVWRSALDVMLGPGIHRSVVYLLVQMSIFVAAGALLGRTLRQVTWLLAICGSICLFSGVATLFAQRIERFHAGPLHARGALLLLVFLSLTMPDVLHYLLFRPEELSLAFSWRHVFSPLHVMLNWDTVLDRGWLMLPILWGVIGLASYLVLLRARKPSSADAVVALRLDAESHGRDGDSH